ncbi:MAG TPA: FecR domain-containing protein [Chitinispirillaceae bacterium]|nr:FecR domain-containing protein [Chitinispirillaceae bacterium]
MNFYNRLIENPLFFKWVFHPTPELDAYWDHYLKVNPQYKEQVLELKSQLKVYFKFQEETLTEIEKRSLAIRIARKMEHADVKIERRNFRKKVLRYVATALIFFFIGSGLVYLYMDRRQPHSFIGDVTLPAQVQEPLLILGNRGKIQLNHGESQVEYSGSGDILLNRGQTIRNDLSKETPEMNTLVIPYGSRTTLTLIDGTKVWLNAGSRLIYPSRFIDKTREVFLVGEAFFEVQKNEEQPFVVKTTDVFVEVLGTKFNISAYPEDYAVQTVLAEGSIEIKGADSKRRDKGVRLIPGQRAYFNVKTKEITTQEVDVEEYTLWTSGLFSFTNADFNRITKRLERYYNIRFKYDNPFMGGIQVSGKLDVTKDRAEVFKYLERLTGLRIIEINETTCISK